MTVLLHVDSADDCQTAVSLLRHFVDDERIGVKVRVVVPASDALAGEVMRALQPHFTKVTHFIRTGEPSSQVLRAVEVIEPDLIVLGTGTESGRPPGPGSTVRKIVERAAAPVSIARPLGSRCGAPAWAGGGAGPFRILVATDGSPCAATAARTLSDLGPPPDAEIIILSVIERSKPLSTPRAAPTCRAELRRAMREIREDEDRAAQAAVERARASLAARPAQVRWITREGKPADEVAQAAGEMNADLVVMGTRGLGRVGRLLWGSVSQRVASSVLLVGPVAATSSAPEPGK